MSNTLAATLSVRAGMAANRAARRLFYRSPVVARALFGSWHERCDGISFFELGTVVMRRALARDLRDGMRVLEIGTGPYAILATWAARRNRLNAVATEIEPEWAERARSVAARVGVPLDVRTCDMTGDIDGLFDAIWFVPPFIARHRFNALVASTWRRSARELELLALRSVGGEQGSELIARFYAEAAPRLSPDGRAYVCFNTQHVAPESVASLARAAGLRLLPDVRLGGGLPYLVHVSERLT